MENLIPIQMQLALAKDELRSCEAFVNGCGLVLTEADITDLVAQRARVLRATGRVELGGGILPKLIRAFGPSPYVDCESFPGILGELQEAFYYFKSEACERFSDDDLIGFMVRVFDGDAAGASDLLTSISLEELCRWARGENDREREEWL